MVGISKVIRCSKCRKEIFYLPDNYKMACKIICIDCGDKPTKKKKKAKTVRTAAANYKRVKGGIRKDIHPTYYFRSGTEANFARILQYHGIPWKFEERSFSFPEYKTRPHVYIMDFEITGKARKKKKDLLVEFEEGFYEIKGYMNPRARTKLRRLKKCYPDEASKTQVVIYTKYRKDDIAFCEKQGYPHMFYDALTKHYEPLISTWE